MKTPILLALLIAAPAFAQDWPGDDSDAPALPEQPAERRRLDTSLPRQLRHSG